MYFSTKICNFRYNIFKKIRHFPEANSIYIISAMLDLKKIMGKRWEEKIVIVYETYNVHFI